MVLGDRTLDELAALARAGDSRALDELLRRIRPDVLRRCAAILLYRPDAEEACQDAMLQVARHIGGFEGRAKFTTWLHPIVTNCVRRTYGSLKRRQAEQAVPDVPAQTPDPRRTSVIAGARIDILEAIERLERRMPDMVEPFMLRDLADLEYKDIVARLGLSLPTVKFRIHEARKFVRGYLATT
jgi:RNA polymerase sigma-70 factor, ECF subfamily